MTNPLQVLPENQGGKWACRLQSSGAAAESDMTGGALYGREESHLCTSTSQVVFPRNLKFKAVPISSYCATPN